MPGTATSARSKIQASTNFRAQIETNLFGVINVTKAALPLMGEPRGRVISSSSPRLVAELGRWAGPLCSRKVGHRRLLRSGHKRGRAARRQNDDQASSQKW